MLIFAYSVIICVLSDAGRKEKSPQKWCIGMLLFGAYRERGILAGEEMMHAISTASVNNTNNAPSAKQVRECGARVDSEDIISRSVLISWYISVLPQYLVVLCTRGMRTPCANSISANLHISTRTSGFGFVRSTKKETDTLLWCLSLFLVTRTGIEPMFSA